MNIPSRPPRLLDERRAGVLLHPTALVGFAGDETRGAIGQAARRFVDWLAEGGFSVWQVLPLGPPGAGGSPYGARSDVAGQVALIDRAELPDPTAERDDYRAFVEASRDWLEDYVLFETLADHHRCAWWDWPEALARHESEALARFASERAEELERRRIEQWWFDWQWRSLRRHAAARGVHLFGDLPIYVAADSTAVWAQREQFQLDASGRPAMLAGVPPDYFSQDGQLWGNPLYDWDQAERDGFSFWRRRLAWQLQRFELVRIDHFRGLAAYWAVPAGARTAREGHWCPAPGRALFDALRAEVPGLPVVAEDLGFITAEVHELRRTFALPGMRVLQFGFDGSADNPHLPHNWAQDIVAYTGTHDNDTTVGWYRGLDTARAERVQRYLDVSAAEVPPAMMRACLASVASLAVLPLQDLLQLDSGSRFNRPGTASGNWSWRVSADALTAPLAARYRTLNELFGRLRAPRAGQ